MMMKYRQNSSTFIPRKKTTPDPDIPADNIPDPSKEKLMLQIEKYNDRIGELEEQLKFRNNEILSSNELIASLQEEITELKNMQIPDIPGDTGDTGDTAEKDSLDIKLSDIEEENARLKKEIAVQNEHAQLLYVLIIILTIM